MSGSLRHFTVLLLLCTCMLAQICFSAAAATANECRAGGQKFASTQLTLSQNEHSTEVRQCLISAFQTRTLNNRCQKITLGHCSCVLNSPLTSKQSTLFFGALHRMISLTNNFSGATEAEVGQGSLYLAYSCSDDQQVVMKNNHSRNRRFAGRDENVKQGGRVFGPNSGGGVQV